MPLSNGVSADPSQRTIELAGQPPIGILPAMYSAGPVPSSKLSTALRYDPAGNEPPAKRSVQLVPSSRTSVKTSAASAVIDAIACSYGPVPSSNTASRIA